jgi:hypothetical protein
MMIFVDLISDKKLKFANRRRPAWRSHMADKPSPAAGEDAPLEALMSAADLRAYMNEMTMASASSAVSAMDKATAARKELEKRLAEPLELTKETVDGIVARVTASMKRAAANGQSEVEVMRFPNSLCTDNGRAINNGEEGWPETLTGRPRQAYELWKTRLQPLEFRLKAQIVDWPGGLPGDVGFSLAWGSSNR